MEGRQQLRVGLAGFTQREGAALLSLSTSVDVH